jgi:hypothetical protein
MTSYLNAWKVKKISVCSQKEIGSYSIEKTILLLSWGDTPLEG